MQMIAWILPVAAVDAHPVAQGSMAVEILPDKIRVEARVSMEEVFVQSTFNTPPLGADKSPNELCRRHGDYLLRHLRIAADGKLLAGRLIDTTPPSRGAVQRAIYHFEYPLATRPGYVRIEEDVLNELDYAPGNRWEATYIVGVSQSGRALEEGLLLTSREPLVIECNWNPAPAETGRATLNKSRLVGQYVRHGIMHILTGYDHLLFIGALVLAVVTFWDLIKVVTAFTVAHSITLTLSTLNVVRLSERTVEPMIAASIVFVALQNVFWPKRSRGATRLGVAFFFGLFHGLGFAGGLLDAMQGMAGLAIGLAIVAFSVGVELGHQVVVVPVFAGLSILRHGGNAGPRLAEHLFRYGSAAIAIAGMFYLIAALR